MLCRIDLFCDAANGSSGHYVSLDFLIVVMLGLHSALNERWNAPKMAEQFRCKREKKEMKAKRRRHIKRSRQQEQNRKK